MKRVILMAIAESETDVSFHHIFPLGKEVFIETLFQRSRSVPKIQETMLSSHYVGCINHRLLEAYSSVSFSLLPEQSYELRPQYGPSFCITYGFTVLEEVLRADFVDKHKIVIHKNEMLAQVWDAPYHRLYRP